MRRVCMQYVGVLVVYLVVKCNSIPNTRGEVPQNDPSAERVRNRSARKFEVHAAEMAESNPHSPTNATAVASDGSPTITLSDQFFNHTVPVYNNKFWLLKEGSPRRLPPAAWCSREVMAVAVPASRNLTSEETSKAGWSSWNSGRRGGKPTEEDEYSCAGRFENEFFNTETGVYDAWVGEARFGSCGGFSVDTEDFSYHINVFRAPGPKNNVIVTCACPLPVVDYEYCAATARWEYASNAVDMWEEDKPRSREKVPLTAKALAGGMPLSVAATAGAENEVSILINANGRVVFESHVYGGEEFYPWPWECTVTCSGHNVIPGGCQQPLIVGGCPISEKLDFQVLSAGGIEDDQSVEAVLVSEDEVPFVEQTKEESASRPRAERRVDTTPPGSIIFSMRSFVFEGDMEHFGEPRPMQFSCQMRLLPSPPKRDEFCKRNIISATGEEVVVEDRASSAVQPRPSPRQDWHVSMNDYSAQRALYSDSILRRLLDSGVLRELDELNWNGEGGALSSHFENLRESARSEESYERFGVEGLAADGVRPPMLQEVKNDIVWDDWHIVWRRDQKDDETQVGVGNWFGYVDVTDFNLHGGKAVMTGWRDVVVDAFVEDHGERYGAAVRKGDYGVGVSRDNPNYATGVNIIMRGVEVGTLADVLDRDYGQRVKVRAFDLSVRHDFDEYLYQDSKELATEVRFIWHGINIVTGTDVVDTHYQVSVTVHGIRMTVLRDFDERQTSFSGNWGNGWKLALSGDWADYKSDEIYGAVGFGQQGRAYVSVGAGITSDGLPQGHAEVQGTDFGLDVDFVEGKSGDMLFGYAITVGKFTYVWDSIILPENIRVPMLTLPGGGF